MKNNKMIRVFKLFLPLSACLAGLAGILFLDACADAVYDDKIMDQIGQLVVKRAETMNDYYTGELEYIHAEEILREFETGDLLEDDLYNLNAWVNTDIDAVNEASVLQVIMTGEGENYLSARVSVSWNVSGLNGNEVFEEEYETVCEKKGKTLKLSQFF